MDSVLSFLNNYKIIDMFIVAVGVYGLYLVFERYRALFGEMALPAEPFTKKILSLIDDDKIEDELPNLEKDTTASGTSEPAANKMEEVD